MDQSVLAALADDLRLQILALTREQPRTTTDLATELGRAKGTVGHHLKVLERAGLVRVVRTRRVRAVTEKYYRSLPEDLFSFGVVEARLLEADVEHFARRLGELVDEFAATESRAGRRFTLLAALYPGGERDE